MIELGKTLSAFMAELELIPSGGRWGSIPRLREQMKRLFSAQVSYTYQKKEGFLHGGARLASRAKLFWEEDTRALFPDQEDEEEPLFTPEVRLVPACLAGRFRSTVTLGQEFFQEILRKPVPLDLRAIKKLRRSPLSIDMYCWLTYRVSYLREPTTIPWEGLALQFGAEYARVANFKQKFLERLKAVQEVYPQVRLLVDLEKGLTLYPSRTHVLGRYSFESTRPRPEGKTEDPTPASPFPPEEEEDEVPF
jgi:hypothetical protein